MLGKIGRLLKRRNADGKEAEESSKKDKKGGGLLSPLNKFYKDKKEWREAAQAMAADFVGHLEEMDDETRDAILHEIFPRRHKFNETAESERDRYAIAADAVDGNGVHNVPVGGGGAGKGTGTGTGAGASATAPKGTGLPGAVGRNAKNLGYAPSGFEPRGQGKHSAVANSGLDMTGDPVMRYPINPRILKHFQSRQWITYNGCALLATHEIINRACSIPAEDAIAHGYKLACASDSHDATNAHETKEERFLFDLKKDADEMGLNDVCVKLNYKKKVFGVAVAIPRVKFRKDARSKTNPNKPYSYEDEFDINMIEPGSYEGFAVVDPVWLTNEFDQESCEDPLSVHYYEPTWVRTNNTKIHRSWYIRVVNTEVPDILKPTYYFGGLSLCQMLYERVWCADKLANEAPLLAMTKRLLIADGNLEQMIQDPRHANLFFRAINYFRDNWSVFVKKPSSNVTQLDTALSDLAPLTMTEYQLAASIAQIPVTKLLKNVPTGLQSTGDYEWDDYAQGLIGIQTKDYEPLLKRHYQLELYSKFPDRKDLKIEIVWNPIDVPKNNEVISMSSNAIQGVTNLLANKAVTIAESRKMLRSTNLPMFNAIETELPQLLAKIESFNDPEKQAELQAKAQMGAMGGGMGGEPGEGDEAQPSQEQDPPTATLTDPKVKENRQVIEECLQTMTEANANAEAQRQRQQMQAAQEQQAQGQQQQQKRKGEEG